ncbi:MAG: VacJ family lipoprotein [Gammaproteobacteria bacterium]|nr:VacJ family lipoprotein [Gammaproteobacteria bacterium]
MKNLLTSFLFLTLSFAVTAEDIDLFEDTNRVIFEFNQGLDEAVFEPTAKAYKENIPKTAQTRVSDFFSNIEDVGTLGNELTQFELVNSVNTLGRVLINSTVGLLGLFDVASEIGLEKTSEDFGQTMAVWGAPEGSFVVLPVLGPSTLRGVTGKAVDNSTYVKQVRSLDATEKTVMTAMQAVDIRVKLLPATDLLKKADDPYIVMRSSYLQKRKYDVHNGNLPDDDEF